MKMSKEYLVRAQKAGIHVTEINPQEDWVCLEEAARHFMMEPKSFKNLIYAKKIPDRFISIDQNDARLFHLPGLMGFESN